MASADAMTPPALKRLTAGALWALVALAAHWAAWACGAGRFGRARP